MRRVVGEDCEILCEDNGRKMVASPSLLIFILDSSSTPAGILTDNVLLRLTLPSPLQFLQGFLMICPDPLQEVQALS